MQTSSAPDAPFPGAHSQVPGARGEPSGAPRMAAGPRRVLPLEATQVTSNGAEWAIRMLCRAEELQVHKRVVVYEQVVLRKRAHENATRVDARLRREELRVDHEEYDSSA